MYFNLNFSKKLNFAQNVSCDLLALRDTGTYYILCIFKVKQKDITLVQSKIVQDQNETFTYFLDCLKCLKDHDLDYSGF